MENKFEHLSIDELLSLYTSREPLLKSTFKEVILPNRKIIEEYEGKLLSDISKDDPNYKLMELYASFTELFDEVTEIGEEILRRSKPKMITYELKPKYF